MFCIEIFRDLQTKFLKIILRRQKIGGELLEVMLTGVKARNKFYILGFTTRAAISKRKQLTEKMIHGALGLTIS